MLQSVRRGELADRALAAEAADLDTRDRAWLQELVYGTLRLRGRLDHILAGRVRRGLDSLEPDVLDILRLGAYQLLEMGGVPAYAAVSQSVDLAHEVSGRGAAGLVNGVLRALQANDAGHEWPDDETSVARLTTWGSHPRWLVERWVQRWGAEAAGRLIERNNQRPTLYLRPLGVDAAAAIGMLGAAGVEARAVPGFENALALAAGADPAMVLATVPGIIQDPAAGRIVDHAAFDPRGVTADLCASPGGKSMALAAMVAEHHGSIIAADRSYRRMSGLRQNAARLPDLPVSLLVADAREPAIRAVDGVLIDVPCTGTGTLGRHPDARWRLKPEDLDALAAIQRDILDAAAAVVAFGGLLVYATCSLEPEENEVQVEKFLRRHDEFVTETGPAPASQLDAHGWLTILPHVHGVDGAFAARLRRR